jgi:hypothetical protein
MFPLAAGSVAFKAAIAAIDLSTGKVEPGHAEGDLFVIGRFAEAMDATLGEKQVNVDLLREMRVDWYANDGIVAADVGQLAYLADDQTVTATPGGSVAGRIWLVDSVKGVAIERLGSLPIDATIGGGGGGVETVLPAYVSNAAAVPANPGHDSIYDVPTTAAASVITLPALAAEGTRIMFAADGVKNGHTVQYRDETGAVNLTTALTASKRHFVVAVSLNGIWVANAYVSP